MTFFLHMTPFSVLRGLDDFTPKKLANGVQEH
jgi:hypothetical protein